VVYFVTDACLLCCVCFSFSIPVHSQEIGWEERLGNCLFCVGWDLRPTKSGFPVMAVIKSGIASQQSVSAVTETVLKVSCSVTAETESEWRYVWYHLIIATNRLRDVNC